MDLECAVAADWLGLFYSSCTGGVCVSQRLSLDFMRALEPSSLRAQPRRMGVPPPLAVTPSMLYGTTYAPQKDGEEGRLVSDWAAYYAGNLGFKRLGVP